MIRLVLFLCLVSSGPGYASEQIEGHTFHTVKEYHKTGAPCACPSDRAKNGRCGRRAALCRDNGYNILDCDGTIVKSIEEYKEVKKSLCGGNDF